MPTLPEATQLPFSRSAKTRLRLTGLLLLVFGLAACSSPETATPASSQADPIPVRVATSRRVPVADKIEASATLEALRRVQPGSKILGRVDRVLIREGEAVQAGQVLAQLENRDLKAALSQAEAALAMAEAQQRSAAAMARRMRDLSGRGSATPKNLEDAQAGEDIANAGVMQAKAGVEAAKVMLSYAEVRSPLTGWVTERRVEAGDMAAPGQPLFVVEDLSTLEARAEIPESDIAGLAPGAVARITIDSLGRVYETTLHRLVPAGDPRSRSFEARFQLPNQDGALRSGFFARVELPKANGREALLIPLSALVERGQVRAVFAAEAGQARLRFVKVGQKTASGEIEILSGLEPGSQFVIDPPFNLKDGAAITATEGN